jgi:AraC family transcriptional regulator of adaptative response / DNA-3-methyladenine glycosylase II
VDVDSCYRALAARDRRFDGLFFVAVETTGIYCRPVCSARTPRRERCRFYRTGAEAERAGYRACFRCRPELAPGAAPVDAAGRLVAAAAAHIDEGYLNERSVDDLAAELGVTARHLRRALEAELGVSPIELAQSRRLALAKQLLHDTELGIAEIALASGFASVRRFNAAFRDRFAAPPSQLRRRRAAGAGELILRLEYRPPLDWAALLAFLAPRALPGVEEVVDGEYRRTARLGDRTGTIAVQGEPARSALVARVSLPLAGAAMAVAARLRALFDLDAQPAQVSEHLGRDRRLRRSVARHPGLRVPGAFDPFEVAVRAVLGQQCSVRGATTLAGRLIAHFGRRLEAPGSLTHLFPSPAALASAPLEAIAAIGMPRARAGAIAALATAFAAGEVRLGRGTPVEEAVAGLEALPGIGPWTSHYVAMRALRWPDAFPSGDLVLRKALGGVSAARARARAERWRPWRAYAAMHLWQTFSEETR